MLVLTRRPGQSIQIGPNVEVRVVRIEGDRVVLGITAPRHVAVVRAELIEQVSGGSNPVSSHLSGVCLASPMLSIPR